MVIVLLLTFLFTLTTYMVIQWIQLKQYWAKRRIPYIPPNPLVGSMTFLRNENPSVWFRRVYDEYKAPYVGMWIFWRPSLLVNSPEIARNILIKDQMNFRNRLTTSGKSDPVGRLNLSSLKDPLWTVIRRRLTVVFTSARLRGIQKLMAEKSKELIERIEMERTKHSPIDLRNVLSDYSTDVIGTASFGLVSDATLTGTGHMRSITKDFMKFDLIRGLSWCCIFFIPELVDIFRFKMFPWESTEFMREILRTIITQRGGFENKIADPRDLLDILIKVKQESGEELDMTEDMMLAQAVVFLLGGFDTTANALTYAIYELAFCPKAQEKLFSELSEEKNKYGDGLFEANVLAELTYLNCVINEVLRKYPVVSWLDRIALADYKVDDHLTIKAGTPVFINIMGLHYDPDFYPDPDVYNPDRFLPENMSKNFTFLPFGEGPRKCIGQRFGLSLVRHGLAAVILNYEIRPLPTSPKPRDIKLVKKGLLTISEQILSVDFVPRHNI